MYSMPLYRPPSEANSLIVQATIGCSHNKCTFCSMYKSKKFRIKSLEEIKKHIDELKNIYGDIRRIFLADGDALIIKFEDLQEILKYINYKFPSCERVTMYASPKSIASKTVTQLKELRNLNLKMVYIGIESGNDEVLEIINKGACREELIKACNKIKMSNIAISATIIAGIAPRELSMRHSIDTGTLISEISPEYASVLSLMLEEGTPLYNQVKCGNFNMLNSIEILEEIKNIIKNINTSKNIIFRGNHASNYISLKGEFMKDKDRLIEDINWCIKNNYLSNEEYRRL